MMKLPASPAFSFAALSRRERWRIACVAIIVAALGATLVLQSLHATRTSRAADEAMRQAWLQRGSVTTAAVDANAVFTRYAIRQGGSTMSWKAASPAEARTSLLALDAAGVKLAAVKIARDGNGFAITAERTP